MSKTNGMNRAFLSLAQAAYLLIFMLARLSRADAMLVRVRSRYEGLKGWVPETSMKMVSRGRWISTSGSLWAKAFLTVRARKRLELKKLIRRLAILSAAM